ncbi:hypothetical protein F4779DRAFT_131481 [Xylariaceae sp. FL0662B]|nr:hypothetical protein F4779DRAFT_131481 [Xylariaceae sp. FL0662B]
MVLARKRMPATKRRSHRKSRRGCRQCKQRHTKCDEHHPVCNNCTTADLPCSYLDQPLLHPTVPVSNTSSPSETPTYSSPSPSSLATSSLPSFAKVFRAASDSEDGSADLRSGDPACPIFTLGHLALLHHLEMYLLNSPHMVPIPGGKDNGDVHELVIRSAMSAPYLMDELLAFSALHLSTLQSDPAAKGQYLRQAAELQTRALTLFNAARPEIRDENCVAMLIFSSILSLHHLFDAVSSRKDFFELLDKFVQYLGLHRGVRAASHHGWHVIRHTELSQLFDTIEGIDQLQHQSQDVGTACDRLASLLAASGDKLGAGPFKACSEAVQSLQWVFYQHHAIPKPSCTHLTLAWPTLVLSEYVELLKQRQPEALVILAHWAMLLHEDRDFCAFGDAGRFLIESIAWYLGSYWDEWLVLPKEALAST